VVKPRAFLGNRPRPRYFRFRSPQQALAAPRLYLTGEVGTIEVQAFLDDGPLTGWQYRAQLEDRLGASTARARLARLAWTDLPERIEAFGGDLFWTLGPLAAGTWWLQVRAVNDAGPGTATEPTQTLVKMEEADMPADLTPAQQAALDRVPTANPPAEKVWKTDAGGMPGWRDDATGEIDTAARAAAAAASALAQTAIDSIPENVPDAPAHDSDAVDYALRVASNGAVSWHQASGETQTGAEIKAALEGLNGANRLDASAVKNLPAAGGGISADQAARLLPAFPDAGSRNDKVAKFDGDVLTWEVDAGGAGGSTDQTARDAASAAQREVDYLEGRLKRLDDLTVDIEDDASNRVYQRVSVATEGGMNEVQTLPASAAAAAADFGAANGVSRISVADTASVTIVFRVPKDTSRTFYRIADDFSFGEITDIGGFGQNVAGEWKYYGITVTNRTGATANADMEIHDDVYRWRGKTLWSQVEGQSVDTRLAGVENTISDLHPGNPSTGWSNITQNSQGGIREYGDAAPTLQVARGIRNNQWRQALTEPQAQFRYGIVRIPAAADVRQYRIQGEGLAEDGSPTFTQPITQWTRLGTSTNNNWQYYSSPAIFGDVSVALQATGSAAHHGTSRYAGQLDRASVLSALGIPAYAAANRSQYLQRKSDESGFNFVAAPAGSGNGVVASGPVTLFDGTNAFANDERYDAINFTHASEWDDYAAIAIAVQNREDVLLTALITKEQLEALATLTVNANWYDGSTPSAVFLIDQGSAGDGIAVGVSNDKGQLLLARTRSGAYTAKIVIQGVNFTGPKGDKGDKGDAGSGTAPTLLADEAAYDALATKVATTLYVW